MKTVLPYAAIAIVVLAVAGVAFPVFFSLGGVEMVRSQTQVSGRGFTATEPHAAPGFRRLLLPRGWARDTRVEAMEDNLAGRPQSRGPRQTLHMGGPDEAWLHFQLGQYSHIGGTVTPVAATLYARPPEAPPWTLADLANGLGRESARLRLLRRVGGVEVFVDANDPEPEGGHPFVVLNDPAKGLRLQMAAGRRLYSQDQLIALGVSVLAQAEPDATALSAGRAERLAAMAALMAASDDSLGRVRTVLGLDGPLSPGLTMLDAASPAWWSATTLHVLMRIGVAPLDGAAPEARAAALAVDRARLEALVARYPGGTPAELRPNDLLALWAHEDEIRIWSLGDGVVQMELRAPHPLYEPLRAALPPDGLGLYREANLYLPETDRVEAWFRLTSAYRDVQSGNDPLVR